MQSNVRITSGALTGARDREGSGDERKGFAPEFRFQVHKRGGCSCTKARTPVTTVTSNRDGETRTTNRLNKIQTNVELFPNVVFHFG